MKLSLAYYGNPILRKKAAPILEINDEIRDLIENMIETMEVEDGIGLAAPQVHHSLAIFITKVPIQVNEEEWEEGLLKVFINPKIIGVSPQTEGLVEGCLSITGLEGEVFRPQEVIVEALNLEGEKFTETFQGLAAHCIMHENDHLNGVLFIDRVASPERKKMDLLLKRIKKKYNPTSS